MTPRTCTPAWWCQRCHKKTAAHCAGRYPWLCSEDSSVQHGASQEQNFPTSSHPHGRCFCLSTLRCLPTQEKSAAVEHCSAPPAPPPPPRRRRRCGVVSLTSVSVNAAAAIVHHLPALDPRLLREPRPPPPRPPSPLRTWPQHSIHSSILHPRKELCRTGGYVAHTLH